LARPATSKARKNCEIGAKYNIRLMGPNIYGFYYTPANLCATFCTAYDVKGSAALSSQSGGIGMAIIGFSRSAKMGVSAIVGLGNKSDIDEDDLLRSSSRTRTPRSSRSTARI
jgi:acyl-CoA synthetase (NDP forming)